MKSKAKKTSADRELAAIGGILDALTELDGESIQRVLDYVFDRLSIDSNRIAVAMQPQSLAPISSLSGELRHAKTQLSIRDLKEEKAPESANQMAALVAYYLSEVAPESERKSFINSSDLERYFKQAGFKLPQKIPQTLSNAAAAGYFEATGNGMYQLNPVGYNLVVHGLPREHAASVSPRKRPAKKKVSRR